MDVVVEDGDRAGLAVMHVAGEVDVYTASSLRRELALHMAARAGDLIIDLGGVTFLDSTGLSVLVRAARQLGERGARLALVVDQDRVVDLLRITALAQVFAVYRTVRDASCHLALRGTQVGVPLPVAGVSGDQSVPTPAD
jgi:anti-sigma B factor antagonist